MTIQRKMLGNSGEEIAANYLEKIYYKILDRNLRLKYGEIDIIARDGDYVVIVEVKTKTVIKQGTPEEMVDYFKQKKLRLLARAVSQMYPNNSIRIDVVAVDETDLNKTKINHIINAIEEI